MRYLANNNQLTGLFLATSGDQQTINANQVLNGDSLTGSGAGSATRPLYIARNTVRTPNVYQLDLRYTRTFFKIWERFRPSFFAEANNVLNHPNITTINTTGHREPSGRDHRQPDICAGIDFARGAHCSTRRAGELVGAEGTRKIIAVES